MLPEHQLVPYHSTDLTGKRVLVIAPHPDDETFGCGGVLKLHRMAGDPVQVVFVTNGAKGDSSGLADKSDYVALRKTEARAACRDLEIEDLMFWPYEDREIVRHPEIAKRLAEVISEYAPGLVYAPSPHEIHPDHRAVTHWLLEGIEPQADPLDIAFYEVGHAGTINCLVDISPVMTAKASAMDRYSSQLQERPYKRITMALNEFRTLTLAPAVQFAEGFLLFSSQTFSDRSFGKVYSDHLQRWHPFYPFTPRGDPEPTSELGRKDWLAAIKHWIQSVKRR